MNCVLALSIGFFAGLVLPVAADVIPAQLPKPDGKPGDATRALKVYILAGQSNMVGMGRYQRRPVALSEPVSLGRSGDCSGGHSNRLD